MPKKEHYWINPSGMSKRDKDRIKYEPPHPRDHHGHPAPRKGRHDVIPNQYIGKGPAAKKAAEEIASKLKGAKVIAESFGAQTTSQTIWERLAHSLIDKFLKGK